jgi:hypothetical protein
VAAGANDLGKHKLFVWMNFAIRPELQKNMPEMAEVSERLSFELRDVAFGS